jgi:glucose-1-phosphate adenylyltransferase
MNNDILAIILGGGQGSRLSRLQKAGQNQRCRLAGNTAWLTFRFLTASTPTSKGCLCLRSSTQLRLNQHIKNTYLFSTFSRAFVDILAAEQTPDNPTWFQGTADAVRQCMQHFLNHEFDYALILSGDQLYQMNFNEMIQAHKDSGAAITIATLPVSAKEAPEFGILKTNHESIITSFIEKPHASLLPDWTSEVSDEMKQQGKHYLASMGIYIFNRDLLIHLMANPDTKDFGKEIIPQAIEEHKVLSYQYEGYWTDIGNIDSFFEANWD